MEICCRRLRFLPLFLDILLTRDSALGPPIFLEAISLYYVIAILRMLFC